MDVKNEGAASGLDRLNALLAWWGMPTDDESGTIDAQAKRLQLFTANLQRAYGDACSRQMETQFKANERLSRSLQDFLRCRKSQEVAALQSDLLATLLEGASRQATIWIDLTLMVHDCCARLTRPGATEAHKPAEEAQAKEGYETKPMPRSGPAPAPRSDAAQPLAHA
jgi:hypothetical protein